MPFKLLIKSRTVFVAGSFFLLACSTESLESTYQDKPIVESYLYVNKPISTKVTRITTYDTDTPLSDDDINNLLISITGDDQSIVLSPIGEGVYESSSSYGVKEGIEYTLAFLFNGKEVSSTTKALSKPTQFTQSATSLVITAFSGSFSGGPPSFPDPVKTSWSNPEKDYYLVVVENTETDPEAINDFGNNAPPAMLFRNEPTQADHYEIRSQLFQYYGKHRIILFHINPEYASLYKESGTSSQNITTPPTNITNGLGIFTAINSDTLFIDIKSK